MRRLVMAHRISASVSPAGKYDIPRLSSPELPNAETVVSGRTPPRAQLPPLRPGVNPGDLVAALDMTLKGLKDRARELGVAEDIIQGVDNAEDAKAAAVDLVMRATKDADDVGELSRRHLNQASRRLRLATKATLGGVKHAYRARAFDHISRSESSTPTSDPEGARMIKGFDTNGDGVIDALDTDGDGLIDTVVEDTGTLREHKKQLEDIKSRVIHVGGLSDAAHENEMKLTKVFGKFGTVIACTLQRRREAQGKQEKVSWALITFETAAQAAAAVGGTGQLGIEGVVSRPLDMEMALASTGNMGRIAALHVSKTEKNQEIQKRHRLLDRFEAVEKYNPDGTKVSFDHTTWAPPPRETAVIFEKTVIDLRHTIGARCCGPRFGFFLRNLFRAIEHGWKRYLVTLGILGCWVIQFLLLMDAFPRPVTRPMLTAMAVLNTVASLLSLLSQNTELFGEVLKCFEAFYILMHATIFILALINLANFDLPYLLLFVSHGITFVQVITLDAWPHKRLVTTTDAGTNIIMRPHQIVFAHLVGIFVFTIAMVYRIYVKSLPGMVELECEIAPHDWCTLPRAVAILDEAGIDPGTLLNVTGNGIGATAHDVDTDEIKPSSFGSYFDVFSETQSIEPYTGWANEAHGWKQLHRGESLQFLNALKLAQTSGTTIVVFLSRHLTKRLMDPDVCVLLKAKICVHQSHGVMKSAEKFGLGLARSRSKSGKQVKEMHFSTGAHGDFKADGSKGHKTGGKTDGGLVQNTIGLLTGA